MNIFILDANPQVSVKYYVDKHIVKMPTETAQMISFIYHDINYWDNEIPNFIMKFSKTHYKHPCSIWIRESLSNFLYTCELGIEIFKEYQYRYNQPDKHQRALQVFEFGISNPPKLEDKGLTQFALAMDEVFINKDLPIESYRNYYRIGKLHLHKWKKRPTPSWIIE